jgi:hypothetical protein
MLMTNRSQIDGALPAFCHVTDTRRDRLANSKRVFLTRYKSTLYDTTNGTGRRNLNRSLAHRLHFSPLFAALRIAKKAIQGEET